MNKAHAYATTSAASLAETEQEPVVLVRIQGPKGGLRASFDLTLQCARELSEELLDAAEEAERKDKGEHK